jgi:hypothetical protein
VVRIVFFIDRRHETPFNFESADLHEYRDRFKNDNTNLTVNKIIIEMIAFFNREEWNSEENEGFLCMHHVHRASCINSSFIARHSFAAWWWRRAAPDLQEDHLPIFSIMEKSQELLLLHRIESNQPFSFLSATIFVSQR